MGRLVYTIGCSLDGYIADERGDFSWTEPDAEVHRYFNDEIRGAAVHLYGRRMYEIMAYWETEPPAGEGTPEEDEFARLWRDAHKVVYSTTLDGVSTRRTTLERDFDPGRVRALKESTAGDVMIGGPVLTAHALRAGLVDEVHLVMWPVVLGGGLPVFPGGLRLALGLLAEQRFPSGAVAVRYRVERVLG